MRGAFGVAGWGRGVRLASLGAPVPECESIVSVPRSRGASGEGRASLHTRSPHAGCQAVLVVLRMTRDAV